MRPTSLLFCSALLLLASDAVAQAGNAPATDDTTISTVQVAAPLHSYWIDQAQAQAISGYYAMSNGWRMKLHAGSRYLDAAVGDDPPMRLIAVSPDKFMTRDGNVTMEFQHGAFTDDVLMTYVEPRLGQRLTVTAQLAQR